MSVAKILEQTKYLSRQERKLLAIQLIEGLEQPEGRKRDISEFAGIAAHLAADEDPQDYVTRIRGEWDDRP